MPLDRALGVLEIVTTEHELRRTVVLKAQQESAHLVGDLPLSVERFDVSSGVVVVSLLSKAHDAVTGDESHTELIDDR